MPESLHKLLNDRKWQIICIACAILIVYIRSLSFEFIGMDEQTLLIEKRNFNKELSNIPKAFSQHVFENEGYRSAPKSTKYYRPLLTVSFILDEHFSRGGFVLYHFTNMLIHFFAVIGLLFIFQQMKISQPLGFALSLIFAVHPLLTQAIAWIPGRNDSLVCAFVLWSFYFLLKYFRDQSNKNMALHLLLFASALFTKENAVMFFFLCLFSLFRMNGNKLPTKNKIIIIASYFAVILGWYLMRKHAVNEMANLLPASEFYHTFLKSAPLLFQYFQKTILPVNLAVMSTVQDTNYGWVLVAFAVFGAGIYFSKKIAWTEIIFGLLWFILFFLPTLLFSYFEGMEHRSYLPMAGLLIGFAHLEPLLGVARNTQKLLTVFGAVILIFSVITFMRLNYFANEPMYWQSAFESSKHSAVVCRDYGVILTKTEHYAEAERAYVEGIKRDPKEMLVHYNLGVLYLKTQHFAEAENQMLQELNIDSTSNAMTYHVLGLIYKQTGKIDQAAAMWKKSLSISPDFQPAIQQLQQIDHRQ